MVAEDYVIPGFQYHCCLKVEVPLEVLETRDVVAFNKSLTKTYPPPKIV